MISFPKHMSLYRLVMALLWVGICSVAGAAVEFRLPENLPATPGQQVEVEVAASGAEDMTGFRIVVLFDANQLSYVPGSTSIVDTIADEFLMPEANAETPGRLVLSSAGLAAVSPTSGTLVRFKFLLSDLVPFGTTIPLQFDPKLTRANDGALSLALVDGFLVTTRSTTLRLNANAIPDPITGRIDMIVSADSLLGVSAFSVDIQTDPSQLGLVADSAATAPGGFDPIVVTQVAAGRWRFSSSNPFPLQSGTGPLFTFQLLATGGASENTIVPVDFVDGPTSLNGGDILLTLVDGSVSIQRLVTVSLPTRVSAEPGDTMELAFRLDTLTGLQGFRFVVNFDPEHLSYIPGSAVTEEVFRQDFTVLAVNATVPGRLIFSGASEQPLSGGTGSLLRFRVRVSEGVPLNTLIPLQFNRTLSRLNDGNMASEFVDGSIIVQHIVRLTIPSEIPGSPGEEVLITVLADDIAGIQGMRISTLFPAEKAAYVDRSATNVATLTERFVALITNSTSSGRLIVSSSGEEPLGPGQGVILRYKLRIDATAGSSGIIPLTLDPALTRLNDGFFGVELISGSIRLGPPTTSFPETDCLIAGPIILGLRPMLPSADINGDGRIDAADLVRCGVQDLPITVGGTILDTPIPDGPCFEGLLGILGSTSNVPLNDTNGDGIVDAADLVNCID